MCTMLDETFPVTSSLCVCTLIDLACQQAFGRAGISIFFPQTEGLLTGYDRSKPATSQSTGNIQYTHCTLYEFW